MRLLCPYFQGTRKATRTTFNTMKPGTTLATFFASCAWLASLLDAASPNFEKCQGEVHPDPCNAFFWVKPSGKNCRCIENTPEQNERANLNAGSTTAMCDPLYDECLACQDVNTNVCLKSAVWKYYFANAQGMYASGSNGGYTCYEVPIGGGGGGGNDISNTTSLAQTRTGDNDAGVGTIGICAYFVTTECKIEVNGVECNSCEEDWREGLYKFDCSNIDPKAGNMTMKTDDTKETTGFIDTLFEPIADIISDKEPRCTHEIPPNDNDYCFADGDGGGTGGGSNIGSFAVQIRGLGMLFLLALSVVFLLHFPS